MTSRALDQFYTRPAVALECWRFLGSHVECSPSDRWLEPSAGAGAFFELLPARQRIGLDIDPRHCEVVRQDFLGEFEPPAHQGRWLTVGNPPFGKNTSLAVRFFNKAATFSDVIAFVVPLTFRKHSLQQRLDSCFSLLAELPLDKDAFVFEGKPYSVPCCFQVWVRSATPRQWTAPVLEHPDFEFVRREQAHFAIRRVGRSAGKVIRDFHRYASTSHYFVRSRIGPELLAQRLEALCLTHEKWSTAGVASLGKRELVAAYQKVYAAEEGNASSALCA